MTPPSTLLATLGIGFALGLRHVLDTDHLVAVSTLVARERSFWRSTRIGAVWGLGHTATLLTMGIFVIALGLKIPAGASVWLETAVAAMLIFLGARTLWNWKTGAAGAEPHQEHPHAHFFHHDEHARGDEQVVLIRQKSVSRPGVSRPGVSRPGVSRPGVSRPGVSRPGVSRPGVSRPGVSRQSFLVGMVHGLSGSAELMLLVLATIRQPGWALIYIAVFGLGMMVAMFALTAFLARLLCLTARFQGGWSRVDLGLRAFTGAASLGFGAHLMWGSALLIAR